MRIPSVVIIHYVTHQDMRSELKPLSKSDETYSVSHYRRPIPALHQAVVLGCEEHKAIGVSDPGVDHRLQILV